MKKSIFILFLLLATSVYSQSPDWSVNAGAYQYNMTFTVFLNVDGVTLTNTQDKVGAFVNGQPRGEATVTYNAYAKKYVAYLSVSANTTGEIISFKIYDSAKNKTTTITKTAVFQINGDVGGIFQSYSIANPELNSQAEITNFSFQGITAESNFIVNNTINIEVASTVDILNLTPVFTTANNAKIYLNKVLQVSGNTTLDFSNDVVFEVLSEDESQKVEYTVKVTKKVDPNSNQITFSNKNFIYDGSEKLLAVEGTIPNDVTVTYANNGLTNVGSKVVTATIKEPGFADVVLTANLVILPATITGVTFSDESFNYNGSEKTITISGNIPAGTTLNYVLNARTDAGSQEAFALITGDNFVNLVLKANLTIEETVFSGFTFDSKSFVFDDTPKSLAITENIPAGTTVVYTNNNKNDVGVYEVTATISRINYQDLVLKANLTITKGVFSGFTFSDENYVYDTKPKSLTILECLPAGTSVSYTNNNIKNVGVHEVTATISSNNYQDSVVKATLTIAKATLSGLGLKSKNYVYDGSSKSLALTGNLPTGTAVVYSNNSFTDAGDYQVTATVSGDNYEDLILNANLKIAKLNQTITFDPISIPSDKNQFELAATSSADLDITYTSSNTDVATISGNTITLKAAGVTIITASQSGNTNYNAAESKFQLVNITTLNKDSFSINENAIILYPNPVSLKLELKLNSEEKLLISIFDTTGKLLNEITDYKSENEIDVSAYAAGNYFLKIKGANGKIAIKRFIKL